MGADLRGEWMQTYSGVMWYHSDPKATEVKIEDISHALSLMCRFAGHTSKFYSVAEHSCRVCKLLPPELQLWGLLHDGSEAFCVDVPRPLKYSPGMEGYKYYESLTMKAICDRFGMSWPEPPAVKQADTRLLLTEQRDLMGRQVKPWKDMVKPLPDVIKPWTPIVAERRFMKLFKQLYKGD